MTATQPTQLFAATLVDELARQGVEAVCLAPGSRSAPLAMAFAHHPGIRVLVHLDERCASFFALGMARSSGRPVAILCTSGTAAAELHPAVVEASYSRAPLLVLTADRPPELREVGANQTIDQARLYGSAVRWYVDPGPPESPSDGGRGWRRLAARAVAEALGPPPGPVHLNLPLREPLVPPAGTVPEPLDDGSEPIRVERGRPHPEAATVARLAEQLRRAERPLLVAGEMRDGHRLAAAVDALAGAAGMPVLAEPSSHLRRAGGRGVVEAHDALLRVEPWAAQHRPDLVLRLGAQPTSRSLARFLAASQAPTVVVDAGGGWRDPELLAGSFLRCDEAPLLAGAAERLGEPGAHGWLDTWCRADRLASAALTEALGDCELFEAHVVRALAAALPAAARVMVGSSMPIRDVDTFWPAGSEQQRFFGNRGASGIDGLVSTGLGVAAAGDAPTALLLGDLSLCHDMNGLWAVRRHELSPLLVVCDNDGGGIFHFLPQAQHSDVFEELFGTPHGLDLEDVARLYRLPFLAVERRGEVDAAVAGGMAARPTMICARFSRAASVAGHRACWQAVEAALSSGL
jgi:2-succinyl-5-enolpyruvyl-6-hydroxy-3-cyclohexene-1-carboxylate synthase